MKTKLDRLSVTFLLLAFGFVLLALVTATLTDGRELFQVFGTLRLGALLGALIFSAISYLSIAWSFSALLRITHHQVGFLRLASITLISTTFNFVVSTAGLSSLAVRLFLFKKEKIPLSIMAPISVAQSMLTNVVLALVCLSGLLYLESREGFQGGVAKILIWTAMGLLMGLVSMTAVVFFHPVARRKVFGWVVRLWHGLERRFLGHHRKEQSIQTALANVEKSIRLLHQGWKPLGYGLFWVSMDWFFTALTLGACFRAVGVDLSPGYLLVGFALAFLSTTLNLLPGGLGVMEGLLTLTYSHFGIPPEKAMAAALLFRLTYFLIPLGISGFLYLDTLKRLIKRDYEKG
jgi:uncharacterized protein (TIRG00374 family)